MTSAKRVILLSAIAILIAGCATKEEHQMQTFIDNHISTVDPLSAEHNRTFYTAEVTGDQKEFEKLKKLRLQLKEIYTDDEKFQFLKKIKDSGNVSDPRLVRQLDKLYLGFLDSQMDTELQKEIIELSTSINEKYNNYRGHIDGKEVTMTEIYKIMTTSKDALEHKKAWLASKEVGDVVVDDYLSLVKLRNKAVKQIGFENFHAYSLATREQSVEEVDRIFGRLDELTAVPFAKMKAKLDAVLAKDYGITVDQLRPWHYHDPFFQRTPLVYELDLDDYYADHDVAQVCTDYFAGVGLPVDDIMARSDLYDKPGKNPHAFAQDVDRHGDVRILCNIANDERWTETTLHELGHAVYFKYHDPKEPWLLREPAHIFTTEAVAMFFGRLSRNAAWMQEMLGLTDDQKTEVEKVAFEYLQFQQILFARWALVMYNFEKAVYANPDQDLNTLWWDMKEKYQFVNRPESKPDAGWASKLHFTRAPCYYHNYMLGELLASQWHNHIVKNILKLEDDADVSFAKDRRIGKYFKDEIFAPGARFHWNEMIRRSTGEYLTPNYFADQFIK